MSYPINYPTPQGANVQIFRRGATQFDWVKPQGASFVWFTLIGAGGGGGGGYRFTGDGSTQPGGGGASGNVTNFMCPAFLIPDELRVAVGRGGDGGENREDSPASNGVAGAATSIIYQQKNDTGYTLLQASGGGEGTGGSSSSGTGGTTAGTDAGGPMTAAGFYQCVRGQDGARNAVITTNDLTFLLGGNGGHFPTSTITGYYGYTAKGISGYSQLSPIPLAIPNSTDAPLVKQGLNSFGCGGNGGGDTGGTYSHGGRGGDGLAIIVTW